MAHPAVKDIREQQRVTITIGGKVVHHYFDFVVTWKSRMVTAFAVKHKKDVKEGLKQVLHAVSDQLGPNFSNDTRILTEAGINRVMIENARKVVSCAKDFDFDARKKITTWAHAVGRDVTAADCDAFIGDGQRGSRAATALVQAGVFSVAKGQLIGPDTVFCNRFTN